MELTDAEKEGTEWMPGSFMCAGCRQSLVQAKANGTLQPSLRCAKCGSPAPFDEQNSRTGEFLCDDCRNAAVGERNGVRQIILTAMREARSPSTIEGYELRAELGRGTNGAVYRAIRKCDGAKVANQGVAFRRSP